MSTDTKKKSALAGLIAATIAIAATLGIYITVSSTSTVGNVSPTIVFSPVFNAQVNQTVFINATVSDKDGISSIIWEQILGPKAQNITEVGDDLYFIPPKNGTYVFTLEAQDKKNEITVSSIPVLVGNASQEPQPPVPPVPPTCEPNEHLVNGSICVPNPPAPCTNGTENFNGTCVPPNPPPNPNPNPQPEPTQNKTIKVVLTGDIASSTAGKAVFNKIKSLNADNVVVLGDLGYSSSLSWFKSTYGTLGNKLNCVVGNHEAANEDGTSSIEKEAKQYCANAYYFKKNHVLFLGFNTNGDLVTQAAEAGKLLTNTQFMQGIKSVHIMSHKPCAVPPNSHHGLEIKSFCDAVKSKIPNGVTTFYDQAHNHVMSSSADGTYKQIGAGGKSHYTCGTNAQFPFCDNAHYGYLQYDIQPDGTTKAGFYDFNGVQVK